MRSPHTRAGISWNESGDGIVLLGDALRPVDGRHTLCVGPDVGILPQCCVEQRFGPFADSLMEVNSDCHRVLTQCILL